MHKYKFVDKSFFFFGKTKKNNCLRSVYLLFISFLLYAKFGFLSVMKYY